MSATKDREGRVYEAYGKRSHQSKLVHTFARGALTPRAAESPP